MVNDYEMVPEKDFDSLKSDIDKIKRNPLGSSVEGKGLKDSIDKLDDSINNLLTLFKTASESIKSESHDTEVMSKKIMPLFEKVERLSEQNEKIAKGIVALAEMFDEFKAKQGDSGQSSKPSFEQQMPSRNFSQPQREMPMPPQMPMMDDFSSPFGPTTQGSQPLPRMEMPPPPQANQKRKLFGFG